ncbi:hypothetical protein [Streptomyces jumonjinensis]|uniref:hypothetical protein n=1 Tax=Streptomyces jumonjinensis TaxID=1945 RepID=UPI003787FA1D
MPTTPPAPGTSGPRPPEIPDTTLDELLLSIPYAELRPHDVAVFACHPGMLTIGMAAVHLHSRPAPDTWDERMQRWYPSEHTAGRTTPTGISTRGVLLLAAGAADHLSGGYVSPEHPALTGHTAEPAPEPVPAPPARHS